MKKILLITILTVLGQTEDLQIEKITKVYDGDTFYVDVANCTNSVILCKNIPIRVKNIDTPELKSKNLHEKELAKKAKNITVAFLNNKNIYLKKCNRDKYFRIDCEVYKENVSLEDILIANKLAVPYYGKTKVTNWNKF